MNVLLDTHAFLWMQLDPGRLSSQAATTIRDSQNEVWVSAVSFWEISLKHGIGKLDLQGVTPEGLVDLIAESGLEVLPLEAADAASFHRLPRNVHRDPFDRMLAWQAIRHGLALVSRDRALSVFEAHGLTVVW